MPINFGVTAKQLICVTKAAHKAICFMVRPPNGGERHVYPPTTEMGSS